MNTHTHLLLASALLARRGEKARNIAVVVGAFLPDVPVFALFGIASAMGYSSQEVFGDFYFRDEMRNLMGAFNSFFVAAVIAGAGWFFRERWWGWPLVFFAAAMTIHAATDLPVHVDDGHRHFWPFSSFVFNSPFSYWDRSHNGGTVSVIEAVLGIVCAIVLWRRFPVMWIRVLCASAIAAYIAVPAYWIWMFG
ncbi:MAG: hypothetical protein AAGA00_14365 [Pseudomonadota bacterium]